MIRNLKKDEYCLSGTFDSVSLFSGEMALTIFGSEYMDVPEPTNEVVAYAERCVAHYNALREDKALLEAIEKGLAAFLFFMHEECDWDEETADRIEAAIRANRSGQGLLPFLKKPGLYIHLPGDSDEVGYLIETECPWEPEHMCDIILRGHVLKYVGPGAGFTPWEEDDTYDLIWNEVDHS